MAVKDREKPIQTIKQLDYIYSQIELLVDLMDERAVNEVLSGNSKDVSKLFDVIEEEAIKIYTTCPAPVMQEKFFELPYLTRSLDESLKVLNYNYFKATMLPDFNMGWHSIEWGNLAQIYVYLAVLAARGLGKSFEYSLAYPLWKMYGRIS